MSITEILQFVDRVVEKQTGEHLDDLEKAVVKGPVSYTHLTLPTNREV